MRREKIKISDSVNLNIIECDKFKTDYISVSCAVPLSKENAAKVALLPSVLSRATAKHPDMRSLGRAADMLYGTHIATDVYKIGAEQIMEFSSYPLRGKYAPDDCDILGGTLDLIEEMMFFPYKENGVFSSEIVEREKRVLVDAIRAKINNKTGYSLRRCTEIMCEGEAAAIPETGYEEDVRKISAVSLAEFYASVYDGARIEVYFVGVCDKDRLKARISEMFAGISHSGSGERSTFKVGSAPEKYREVIEDSASSQGKLSFGFRTGCRLCDKDYPAYALFCEIFGGSAVSKLFMNVRERMSLCYYCSAISSPVSGLMYVAAGINSEDFDSCRDEILAQLKECADGNITPDEIRLAKKSMLSDYAKINDFAGSLKRWYLLRDFACPNLECDVTPEDMARAVDSLGADDVSAAAKKVVPDTVFLLRGTKPCDTEDEDDEEM